VGAVTEILEKLYMGDSDVILMPACFRRHLVGKTVINVFHCDIAEIRFVGELVNFNRTINLRPLTPHIMPFYTHKNGDRIVAIDSMTSLHAVHCDRNLCVCCFV